MENVASDVEETPKPLNDVSPATEEPNNLRLPHVDSTRAEWDYEEIDRILNHIQKNHACSVNGLEDPKQCNWPDRPESGVAPEVLARQATLRKRRTLIIGIFGVITVIYLTTKAIIYTPTLWSIDRNRFGTIETHINKELTITVIILIILASFVPAILGILLNKFIMALFIFFKLPEPGRIRRCCMTSSFPSYTSDPWWVETAIIIQFLSTIGLIATSLAFIVFG